MTVKAVEWALRQKVDGTAKTVLIMLADAINTKHEFCWPSRERIALYAGCSPRHLRRIFARLSAAGLVRVEGGAGLGRGHGREGSRFYLACDHRTGQDRPLEVSAPLFDGFKGGSIGEAMSSCNPYAPSLTGGHPCPPVTLTPHHLQEDIVPAAGFTGGHPGPLQEDIHVRPLYVLEEPEKEPEQRARGALGAREILANNPSAILERGSEPTSGPIEPTQPAAPSQPKVDAPEFEPPPIADLFEAIAPAVVASETPKDAPPAATGRAVAGKKPKPVSSDAGKLIAALRASGALSERGKTRIERVPCEKVLPPLIAKYGFDAVLAAAIRYYREPDCVRNGGEYQKGLQVIARNGMLEDRIGLVDDPPPPEADPLLLPRMWCESRRRFGEWGARARIDEIPPQVRAEFPELFA